MALLPLLPSWPHVHPIAPTETAHSNTPLILRNEVKLVLPVVHCVTFELKLRNCKAGIHVQSFVKLVQKKEVMGMLRIMEFVTFPPSRRNPFL